MQNINIRLWGKLLCTKLHKVKLHYAAPFTQMQRLQVAET